MIGLAVAGHSEQTSGGSASDQTDHSGDETGQTILESWERSRWLDLTLAYAGRQNKRLAMGAAAEIELSRSGNTLGEGTMSDISTGNHEERWEDGELVYLWEGERWARQRQVTGVLGLAHERDGRVLALDALVGWKRAWSEVWAKEWEWSDEDGSVVRTYERSGTHDGSGLGGNEQGWGPGLRLETLFPVGDRGELLLRASSQIWLLGPVDTAAEESWPQGADDPVNYEIESAWGQELTSQVLVAGGFAEGPFAVRAGVRLTTSKATSSITSTEGKGTPEETWDLSSRSTYVSSPMAIEAQVHERWILREGGS